uniref:Retrovirus-related Pol polyprotein from transposon TNT 1-94 n=1 Tax=Tanacetum cinerariifolium TaxID=118510 RepID=A0A6L2K271_TANCI|nr:retrovirus-related Pol polyprotein from transposon TNT 1-94 [Tanacetum cinerariifolium]
MEETRNKPKELLPYGMLLTRLFKDVLSIFLELAIDHYLSYDRVMHLLAPLYERKTQSDHGKKRPHDSNTSSSSTTLNHPSLFYPLDNIVDENDEESYRSNSSSPSQNVSSLKFKSLCGLLIAVVQSIRLGKRKKSSHPPKVVPNTHSKLELLYMVLCGPMRVASINRKKYILVIFDDYSQFTWAEAVSTACFTQNRSIIHTRYNKTPYELRHERKPNVEYFYMFGSLCYPTNDRDSLGKMKPKADIGIFIGYSETSKGFQIYNRRTKKIMETIHIKFDELTAMASEHDSLEPISQQFINNDSSTESMNTPSKEDLDNLFGPIYKEYFEKRSSDMSINSSAQQVHNHKDLPLTSSFFVM